VGGGERGAKGRGGAGGRFSGNDHGGPRREGVGGKERQGGAAGRGHLLGGGWAHQRKKISGARPKKRRFGGGKGATGAKGWTKRGTIGMVWTTPMVATCQN